MAKRILDPYDNELDRAIDRFMLRVVRGGLIGLSLLFIILGIVGLLALLRWA
jgi:hypothetical protein